MAGGCVAGRLAAWLLTAGLALMPAFACAADDEADRDNPPIPSAEVRRVTINVFPNEVIVVKGKMIGLKNLREHLRELVPNARKPAVEVLLIPHSKKEMGLVSGIIVMAKELGYTKVHFVGPKKRRPKITEIRILLSKTGDIVVDNDRIARKRLKEHLEKKVDEKRREKVRIYIRATRLVKLKRVRETTVLCRSLGFKDIVFGIIAE